MIQIMKNTNLVDKERYTNQEAVLPALNYVPQECLQH